jgi:hypothetical protein
MWGIQRPRVIARVKPRIGVEQVVQKVVRDMREDDPDECQREPAGRERRLADGEQPSRRTRSQRVTRSRSPAGGLTVLRACRQLLSRPGLATAGEMSLMAVGREPSAS